MRSQRFVSLVSVALLLGTSALFSNGLSAEMLPTEKQCKKIDNPSEEIQGWCLAINRKQGNCLACHLMIVSEWPKGFPEGGNIAPPLIAIKARFPDDEKLRAQIYDATANNPNSVMPPFGAHGMLSNKQIDKIIVFLKTI